MPQRKEMDFKKYRVYNLGALEITKGVKFAVSRITANTLLGANHHWVFTSLSNITLPAASEHVGREYYIKNTNPTNSIDIFIPGGSVSLAAGITLHVVSDGTTWQRITLA